MSSKDFRAISVEAQARRAAALPKDFLLPPHLLHSLPKNVTSIPTTSGHFTADELEIISATVSKILERIASQQWTSLAVTSAFCKSATVAQQLTNCVTEVLFASALQRAADLDAHLAKTGKLVGPLHGLPISLKDCFITPPHPSSVGMAAYASVIPQAQEETTIVTLIRQQGAVPYVKTNVPTAMMMMETCNNVWGDTINPVHTGCSAGGSSGGEGALIAMRGSPLGIGTDIGGSIRIPAAFCGLYGLKPSYGRYPQYGGRSGIPGQDFVYAVNGPMGRDLESLQLYSAAVLSDDPSASPWRLDPKCSAIPWRTSPQITPAGRKLRIAVVPAHDGLVTAHPPVARALRETRAALEAAGHTVETWDPTENPSMVKLLLAAFFNFGGEPIIKLMREYGEPVYNALGGYLQAAEVGEKNAGFTPSALREMVIQRNDFMKRVLDKWTGYEKDGRGMLDGVVMAASPWSAVRYRGTESEDGPGAYFGYTAVWSLLDLPACAFPVSTVKNEDAQGEFQGPPLSAVDEKIRADWDAKFYEGAPVSLQCVGERLQEEKLLEVVGRIRDALSSAGVD